MVDSKGDRKAVSRLLIVACVALVWMTAVFGRLDICNFSFTANTWPGARQQQRVIEITPKRGAIYDRTCTRWR